MIIQGRPTYFLSNTFSMKTVGMHFWLSFLLTVRMIKRIPTYSFIWNDVTFLYYEATTQSPSCEQMSSLIPSHAMLRGVVTKLVVLALSEDTKGYLSVSPCI